MKRALASEICTFLEQIVFTYFGTPSIVIADNGSQFKSKEFKTLIDKYKISNIWFNARYHPQCNNVERSNRVISTAIRSYIKDKNHRNWDQNIHQICNAINSASHEVTKCSPAFLVFGRNLPLSREYYGLLSNKQLSPYKFVDRNELVSELSKLPDVYSVVDKNIQASYNRNKKYYDLRKRHVEFNEGDVVYKRNFVLSDAPNHFSSKLAKKYITCRVLKKISPIIYELLNDEGKRLGRFHIKDLKASLHVDYDDESESE